MDSLSGLRTQVESACRHLLSEQNRDPYTETYGCFDRRYWGWKLVDYPEATFQRNIYPLAWWATQSDIEEEHAGLLMEAVQAGLEFSTQIQHTDGSFDQAFPHEHSFGATAFLLHSLLTSYQIVYTACPSNFQASIEDSLRRAADFLYKNDETHGHIANHLAGAVLSLLVSARFFNEARYENKADELLDRIISHQSQEGWFIEYEGADPGYQSLCLYYLAQVYRLSPRADLREALVKAIDFLAWFVHPDGTFGGEYGSRRTAIFYPGGLALLSKEFPTAQSITRFMLEAIVDKRTVTMADIDIGNYAPLLSNYITLLDAERPDKTESSPLLPWQAGDVSQDFSEAGLHIRGTRDYYVVVGASNGGTAKVYDVNKQVVIWNDAGYIGKTYKSTYITTQITDPVRKNQIAPDTIRIEAPFYVMLRATPRPSQFLLLRILNLTIMRHVGIGNWLKKILVNLLISGKRTVPLTLSRTIVFEPDGIIIDDCIRQQGVLKLEWLEFGRPFVAIHMASARYFEQTALASSAIRLTSSDLDHLNKTGEVQKQTKVF